jgi:hypothetical protein
MEAFPFLIAFSLSDLGWVRVDALDDLVGPVFITHPSDPTVCLTVDENDRFLAYPLPSDVPPDEPMIVNQVFVGSRLLGSTSRFTFKSYRGKYLSSDKIGVVQCDREAISGLEEWEPVVTEAGVAFQNTHGKFMMVDQVANGGKKKKKKNLHTLSGTHRSLWGIQDSKYGQMPTKLAFAKLSGYSARPNSRTSEGRKPRRSLMLIKLNWTMCK